MKTVSGTRRLRIRLLWWTIQDKILKALMIRHLAAARVLLWNLDDHRPEMMQSPRRMRRILQVTAAVRAFESFGGMVTDEPIHAQRSTRHDVKGSRPGRN